MENERDKVLMTAASVILAVAILVLVVDWQIKNAILAESKALKLSIDSFERRYWNGQTVVADPDSSGIDVDSPGSDVVVGIARVEKTADPEEDSSNAWSETTVERSAVSRPRKRSVAISEGD